MSGRKKRRERRANRRRSGSTRWPGLYGEFYLQIRSWFGARVASEQDADDLAEEVLTRLVRGRTPDDLRAYIATAMANALARYRRRRARERDFLRKLLGEANRADGMDGSEPKDLSEEGESSEKHGEVEKILNSLPPGQADLLRLRFLEGLRVAEVARRMGCSREVAYKRLQRVIQRLRERYRVEPSGSVEREDQNDS